MHAIDMSKINAQAQAVVTPARKPSVKLVTYAAFLDEMLTRKALTTPKGVVRAARLGAFRRAAKPYTLGQVRAHVKYRRAHQPEIAATYVKAAFAL